MKTREKIIDLSDIKEDELDKTASFTDLMSRSERKKRRKEKEEKIYYEEVEENNDQNNHSNEEMENVSELENIEEVLEKTEKYENLTKDIENKIDSMEDETVEIFEDDNDNNYGSGMMIASGLFLIISTFIFLYVILFTDYLNKQTFLYVDIISLLSMYFIFSISIIASKKVSKILSIIIYLTFIYFTVFNTLLLLNYIK